VEQSSLSQQLAVLRKSNIVAGRKDGLNVYYSVTDPAVFRLVDEARQIFKGHYADLLSQLNQKARSK
ncbi:MAG TPA: hypothetical protein VFU76_17080, partial [Terriglobales bacterium]|nr:hypothetical protein [Terriglobales bacterium]